MSKNVIISILIAFVVTNVQNGDPPPSQEQTDLVTNVVQPELWPDLWFDLIPYKNEWLEVSRLLDRRARQGTKKKLMSIPKIMACEYGVRFHWFLSLAIHVVGECSDLSLRVPDHSSYCWTKLGEGLQKGSYTMLVTLNTLEKIHSIIGDNINLDAFFLILLNMINYFMQHGIAESSAVLRNSLTYMETLKIKTSSLQDFLVTECKPRFIPLNIEYLMHENQGQENRYDFYFRKMYFYIGYVSRHLTKLGFDCDSSTGRVTFNGPPPVTLTPNQQDLIDELFKLKHWREIWFTSVNDEEDWMAVELLVNPRLRPMPLKKLHLAPQMLGCMYGVKFVWFLQLALGVIDECNRLSHNNDGSTSSCWNRLRKVLQKGLSTTEKVMHSLTYTHYTIGDDINSNLFYQHMSMIRDFLHGHSSRECTIILPDGLNYVQLIRNHVVNLHAYLTSNCQPAYPLLNTNELINERQRQFPRATLLDLYLHKMEYYMEHISNHLLKMGFRNDPSTGHTIFMYPL